MELSPRLYRTFVRPKCLTKYFLNHNIGNDFDFNNKSILDFGCGIGTNSVLFPIEGYIGIDCDEIRVKYAKKLYPGYRFLCVKDNHLPFKDDSIDYIVILSVLHHIPSKILLQYFKEFRRVLKKDGMIIAVEPCLLNRSPLCNWTMSHLDRGKYIRKPKEYIHLFKKSSYKASIIKKYRYLYCYNKIFITATPTN